MNTKCEDAQNQAMPYPSAHAVFDCKREHRQDWTPTQDRCPRQQQDHPSENEHQRRGSNGDGSHRMQRGARVCVIGNNANEGGKEHGHLEAKPLQLGLRVVAQTCPKTTPGILTERHERHVWLKSWTVESCSNRKSWQHGRFTTGTNGLVRRHAVTSGVTR